MDQIVDLDVLAAELRALRAGWESRGLEVGALTWRDAQAPWPQPIITERAQVADPESVGLTMDAAPGVEFSRYAELVLWCGGWADMNCVIDGQIHSEAPHFSNVAECVAVAERLADRLLLPGTGDL